MTMEHSSSGDGVLQETGDPGNNTRVMRKVNKPKEYTRKLQLIVIICWPWGKIESHLATIKNEPLKFALILIEEARGMSENLLFHRFFFFWQQIHNFVISFMWVSDSQFDML